MKNVIMVLPRRTIRKADPLPEGTVFRDFRLLQDDRCLVETAVVSAEEFGIRRDRLDFHPAPAASRQDIRMAVQRAVLEHEKRASRYPLYTVLCEEDLDRIRILSRLEFQPYFGEWKEATAQESEAAWETITEALRNEETEENCAD